MLDRSGHLGLEARYDVSEQQWILIPLLAGSKTDMTNPLWK
jgi:hypothetical protein